MALLTYRASFTIGAGALDATTRSAQSLSPPERRAAGDCGFIEIPRGIVTPQAEWYTQRSADRRRG